MTLNGGNVTLTEMKKYGARQKKFNEDRFLLSTTKCIGR